MRSRAERRHEFEKRAARGIERYKFKDWPATPDEPEHIKRDRFRKKWCGCWMCARVRASEGPTIQELRFLAESMQ